MIIIGIDPGTATVGYGVIEIKKNSKNNKLKTLDYGTIETKPNIPKEKRLERIYLDLISLIDEYNPEYMVVEELYFFKNIKTAIPVSEARGVILLAIAKRNIELLEFTPLQVKTGVCGYGKATKKQVQRIVKQILNLKEIPKPDDAADALALAICSQNSIRGKSVKN